jgi:outer membrane protein assembly factor BamC
LAAPRVLGWNLGWILGWAVLALGCSTPNERQADVAYGKAVNQPLLEVPPDLSPIDQRELLRVPGDGSGKIQSNTLLPEPDTVKLVREGEAVWLEIETSPEALWPRLREFWAAQQLEVERDEPLLGLMETAWVKYRPVIPTSGLRRPMEGPVSDQYSASSLDKYRLRLERLSDREGVRLFLTHLNMDGEVAKDNASASETLWKRRPGDAERIAEMTVRLLVFLGVEEQKARGILSAEEARNVFSPAYVYQDPQGTRVLIVTQTLYRLWPQVSDVLEDAGMEIDEEDKDAGRFDVIYRGELLKTAADATKRSGFFRRILSFFGGKEKKREYQVLLQEQPGGTRITLVDPSGERPSDEVDAGVLDHLQASFAGRGE